MMRFFLAAVPLLAIAAAYAGPPEVVVRRLAPARNELSLLLNRRLPHHGNPDAWQ
jgi:hypothetical protein